MEEKITIELTPLLAGVLQRLLVDEMENQQKWIVEEENEFGINDKHREIREKVITDCDELRTQLESKGFHKYYKCY